MNYVIIPKNVNGIDERPAWGLVQDIRNGFCRVVSSKYDLVFKQSNEEGDSFSIGYVLLQGSFTSLDDSRTGDKLFIFEESACNPTDDAVKWLFENVLEETVFFIHFGGKNFADLNEASISKFFAERFDGYDVSPYQCFPINGRALARDQYSSKIWEVSDKLELNKNKGTDGYKFVDIFNLLHQAKVKASIAWDISKQQEFYQIYQSLYSELIFNKIETEESVEEILRNRFGYRNDELKMFHEMSLTTVSDFFKKFEEISDKLSKHHAQNTDR